MAQGVASAPAPQPAYRERSRPSDQGFSSKREPHRHTYGAIDLGTNNCRLADRASKRGRIHRHRCVFADRSLGRGARREAGHCLRRRWTVQSVHLAVCAEKLRRRNVSLSRSVATEACRRAANGRDFADRVRDRNRDRPRNHRTRRRKRGWRFSAVTSCSNPAMVRH